MATISLNHKDRVTDKVKKIDNLFDLLVASKERKSVLFVGENNFTLTVAFAALRKFNRSAGDIAEQLEKLEIGSDTYNDWEGIVSTRYEPRGQISDEEFVGDTSVHCVPVPVWSEVKLACIDESITFRDPFPVLKSLIDLPSMPDSNVWCGIDSCAVPPSLMSNSAVIWFQCPWDGLHTVGELILNILMKNAIPSGSYVCIGVVKKFPYIKSYSLESILGERLRAKDDSTDVLKKYEFLGADDVLIKKLLSFGYRHKCYREDRDIHQDILGDHVTLVLRKK